MPARFTKDPSAVLDYKFDWAPRTHDTGPSDWLAAGEVIATHLVTVPTGITLQSSSITDAGKSVTAWLSGGTRNGNYQVTCRITTNAGRTDERSIWIEVRNR